MTVKVFLIFTILSFASLQVVINDDGVSNGPQGLTRLAVNSVKGTGDVMSSGADVMASGVDLGTTSLTNSLQALKGTLDLAKNIQQMKYESLRRTRHAAGRLGTSLTNLGTGAIEGTLKRGADAVEQTQRAAEFTLGEADKVGTAGKRVAKSAVSNTAGGLVNVLDGVNKVVTSTGEVREVFVDGAGEIHDAGTGLVQEGVQTWKDLTLASLRNFRKSLKKAREEALKTAGVDDLDKLKSGDKKPEDTKPEDKKPEDKKPEDKKPEDKKTEGKNEYPQASAKPEDENKDKKPASNSGWGGWFS